MTMLGTVAATDYGWYEFLSRHPMPEINFWRPFDQRRISAPGFSPFFFKLKPPHRAIAGFGYFARWSSLPSWLAWECFGQGNGCETLADFESRLRERRARIRHLPARDPANIGCSLLLQPTFFPRDAWVRQPRKRRVRTVPSEAYDLTVGEGLRIWTECQERAGVSAAPSAGLPRVAAPAGARYGAPLVTLPRLGQGTFRISVLEAYERSCAVTGEHSLPALEAAHIRSYEKDGPHEVRNGLLLRADLHRLFDKGYVTVTPDLHVEVSLHLRAHYHDGRTYYPMHGLALRVPGSQQDRPSPEFLAWHNENVFLR